METGLTIQQVAQQTGLSIDTLRYYERIGLLEPIGRAQNGHRRYTQHDLAWIDLLIRLRNTGMPRAQMVRFAQLRRQGSATLTERRLMLEQHQRSLERHMQELEQHMAELQQSMALHEESVLDPRFGDYVNHDFAEYHIATNADVGKIDVSWIDEDDPHVNPMGAKGIGEVGIVGTAAAIANAVYHATGIRVRDLPITLDKLLQ